LLQDIKNKSDIETLINHFYGKIKLDELMGPIFNHIANVDWEHHLPKMYSFWEMILFDTPGYQGHPLKPHLALNAHHQINGQHFETWLALFSVAVDELFIGAKADEIKTKAKEIGATWMYKLDYLNKVEHN
jgi:hemoglobin